MKCICGYETSGDADTPEQPLFRRLDMTRLPFWLKVVITATTAQSTASVASVNVVELYACPRCGTVRTSLDGLRLPELKEGKCGD